VLGKRPFSLGNGGVFTFSQACFLHTRLTPRLGLFADSGFSQIRLAETLLVLHLIKGDFGRPAMTD